MRFLETVKFWWRVKKANRKLLQTLKTADRTPYVTTKEDVDEWFEKNPFKITREELCARRTIVEVRKVPVHTFKDI
jgi:SET domain-containing protein